MSTESMRAPRPGTAGDADFMPLHGIDHVELYVGNAAQSAYFYTVSYTHLTLPTTPYV